MWSHSRCAVPFTGDAKCDTTKYLSSVREAKRHFGLLYSRHVVGTPDAMASDPPPPFVRHDPSKVFCGWCQREIAPGGKVFITPSSRP